MNGTTQRNKQTGKLNVRTETLSPKAPNLEDKRIRQTSEKSDQPKKKKRQGRREGTHNSLHIPPPSQVNGHPGLKLLPVYHSLMQRTFTWFSAAVLEWESQLCLD